MGNILVVEDDVEIRTGIKYLLVEQGFSIKEAEDGDKALKILEKENFDLIISDIMMPNKDGFELLEEIQKDKFLSQIPFLFLSAKSSYEDYRRGMDLGLDDYLTKPFKASELINAVNIRLKKKNEIDSKFENLKSNITKYIPHEMRTPLVSIIGFSDLITSLSKDEISENVFEMVETINVAGNRLLRTIEKFLVLAELKTDQLTEENKNKKEYEKYLISEEINLICSRLQKIYKNKNEFTIDISNANVLMPQEYFKLIMTELIDNAYKFSEDFKKIEISSKMYKNFVKIEISNWGKEFNKTHIKQISEFLQFDREEFQQNGNGLGLQIAKYVLKNTKSELKISSRKNDKSKPKNPDKKI